MCRASPPCSHGSSLPTLNETDCRLGRVAKNRSGQTRKNRARKIHRLLASEADDLGEAANGAAELPARNTQMTPAVDRAADA